ncbi:hypothetical protein [Azohydromonas lata]|uniref:Uncharacterized protein n=1 Tax=Azohydromonas lata TaxID=45677 RepID=A0ABU5IKJ0_9BURK|nr:hypothetical protein [Azohydromonas lata]MDZ5459422.1 hypothetical protein [Azohydromonas lata]
MDAMVSVWWLLVAFWVGGVLGLLLGAVAALSRAPREGGKGIPDDRREPRMPPPGPSRHAHGGGAVPRG